MDSRENPTTLVTCPACKRPWDLLPLSQTGPRLLRMRALDWMDADFSVTSPLWTRAGSPLPFPCAAYSALDQDKSAFSSLDGSRRCRSKRTKKSWDSFPMVTSVALYFAVISYDFTDTQSHTGDHGIAFPWSPVWLCVSVKSYEITAKYCNFQVAQLSSITHYHGSSNTSTETFSWRYCRGF